MRKQGGGPSATARQGVSTPAPAPEAPASLTIVIPTLNEEAALPAVLDAVCAEAVEAIVVDGGSTDDTVRIATRAGVRLITGARGRAVQMNAGAKAAACDAVLFLHADSLPPAGFRQTVLDVLADPEVVVGAFRFSLAATTPALRLVEWGTNLRARWLQMPYGDQGLFMRRETWRDLGGFPEIPLMEDYDLVRAARRVGRVAIAPTALVTSDRRWRTTGPWRYTAINTIIVVRRHLGATPAQLAEWRARYSKR
ncbi:MAG: TIGR04283 family arsenosugar biosynthesis glycosyltransferase [Anaerosomatales bacterium]